METTASPASYSPLKSASSWRRSSWRRSGASALSISSSSPSSEASSSSSPRSADLAARAARSARGAASGERARRRRGRGLCWSSQKPGSPIASSSSARRSLRPSGSKVITDPGELGPDLLELSLDRAALSHGARDGQPDAGRASWHARQAAARRPVPVEGHAPLRAHRAVERSEARRSGGAARVESQAGEESARRQAPWHFLYFLPEPHGQGSLRPTRSSSATTRWPRGDVVAPAAAPRAVAARPAAPAAAPPLRRRAIASAPASDSCS